MIQDMEKSVVRREVIITRLVIPMIPVTDGYLDGCLGYFNWVFVTPRPK